MNLDILTSKLNQVLANNYYIYISSGRKATLYRSHCNIYRYRQTFFR